MPRGSAELELSIPPKMYAFPVYILFHHIPNAGRRISLEIPLFIIQYEDLSIIIRLHFSVEQI